MVADTFHQPASPIKLFVRVIITLYNNNNNIIFAVLDYQKKIHSIFPVQFIYIARNHGVHTLCDCTCFIAYLPIPHSTNSNEILVQRKEGRRKQRSP